MRNTRLPVDTRGSKIGAAWITRLLDRIDEWATAPIDDDAQRRGWTVARRPGTRTHTYRDPRWDRRHICDGCAGSGAEGAWQCPVCDGTGVVTDVLALHAGGAL
jgi:hypothetical protein